MNPKIKSQTSIAKFEEFFTNQYKDKVFEILETYPDNRSLIVDYTLLEVFDPDLADLLIDKPEEVIEAARIAVKNIDPLAKSADLNIRFKNVTNIIPLQLLNSKYVGSFVQVEGIIDKMGEPTPIIENAVFECRGCMRLHEVEQYSDRTIIEPSLCGECGGRSFRLLQEESHYIDKQVLLIGDNKTSRKLEIILDDDLTSWDDYNIGDAMLFTGTFKVYKQSKNSPFTFYLYCNNVERIENELLIEDYYEPVDEKEPGDRNSPEYTDWRNKVINRDRVCKICGGDKHLHAHHIYSYHANPELRIDVDNGITLCQFCHDKYHSYYGKKSNPQTLMEFIKRFRI